MSVSSAATRVRDFPGTIEGVSDAETWLAAQMAELDLDADTKFAINLCVEELFLNSVKHGRASRATIKLWAVPDGAGVEFADDGAPFDPTLAPVKRLEGPTHDFEIGGFGAGLVQKFSKHMRYRRLDGRNRILLEFGADGALGPADPPSVRCSQANG